jgi:hypothetical protein
MPLSIFPEKMTVGNVILTILNYYLPKWRFLYTKEQSFVPE